MKEIIEPEHYKMKGSLEHIELQRQMLTKEEFKGFLKGNIQKYEYRLGQKHYINAYMLEKLIDLLPKDNCAVMKDNIVALIHLWQIEINTLMTDADVGKRDWYRRKLEEFKCITGDDDFYYYKPAFTKQHRWVLVAIAVCLLFWVFLIFRLF